MHENSAEATELLADVHQADQPVQAFSLFYFR